MNAQIHHLAVHADRFARLQAETRQARLARSGRSTQTASTGRQHLRHAVGRLLIQAGQRIAAEAPTAEHSIEHTVPAGSR